jgi:[ribosomal protein S5]-alanine N-acetyltransferase
LNVSVKRSKTRTPAKRELGLVGPRVVLRPPRPADEQEFLELAAASRILHRPWVYPPSDGKEFRAYVARSKEERHACFLVHLRESRRIAGVVNLNEIIRGGLQSAFLGYWIGASHTGQGLMSEAIRLALRHAFTTLALHRVEANIQPGNDASRAVARRCGFVREGFSPRYLRINGRWCDHERWAIRVEQWKALAADQRNPAQVR